MRLDNVKRFRRTATVPASFLLVCTGLLAAPQPPPPEGEPAIPEARPGEEREAGTSFPGLAVPDRALRFKDPRIAELAGRILDGSADFLVTTYNAVDGPSGFASAGEIPPADSTCAP